MTLSDLLDSFFKEIRDLKPNFCEDFTYWYQDVGGADVLGQLCQDYSSKSEAIKVCEHVTTTWFADKQPLWPTVLGHLLCVIHEPLQLGDECLETFRGAVGSYLIRNDIAPWWDTRAIWGIFVSANENVVLPISVIIAEGRQDRLAPIALAGNFRGDPQMEGQLKLAKDLCKPFLEKPDRLRDLALPVFGFDPNRRKHPDESYRHQGAYFPLFGKWVQRIPKLSFFIISVVSLLIAFLLLRLPLPRSYGDAAFLFTIVSLLGLILSVPWHQIPKPHGLVLGQRNSNNSANRLDRTYFQVFIHNGETRQFQGPSAGLAVFCAFAAEILHKRNILLPWQRKMQKEIKRYAASAKLLRDGDLERIEQVEDKLQAVMDHNGRCHESEEIKTVIFASEQPGEIIQAWLELTKHLHGAAEDLLNWAEDQASNCKWVRSRSGITFVTCPSTKAFLRFFRPAWKPQWFMSRVFSFGVALLLLYSIMGLPPSPPVMDVQIGGKEATPCSTIPSAICLKMQPGEGVVITTRVLSPRLLWPSHWLLDWPLSFSVVSTDPVCSDELPSITIISSQLEKSYPLSKEIHKEIQIEEDVFCFMPKMPPDRDSVSVAVIVIDKLNRDDQQLILFVLEE